MLTDKELKNRFKKEITKNYEKYYPVRVLKKEGFIRKQCSCGQWFWTVNQKQEKCGDAACSGGFNIVNVSPAKNKLSYIEVWNSFKRMFSKRGYTPITRYPVVSRWNPTTEFTNASIAAFQPWVISGESEPPTKTLVIPQFCLRFGDIDNVGITGAHFTGFVMIGQHAFVSPKEWDQEKFFQDIYDYITKEVGLDKKELTLHEDAWAGGGNYGPCIEFFSRGIELFNQVYMMYQHTENGDYELSIKVLDMGLGMERIAWFSQGTPNIYEATFPRIMDYLRKKCHVVMDHDLYARFSKYSAYLNIDEVENIDEAWKNVADHLKVDADVLKKKILPMTGLYSIAEHTRSLLFAITDGALPSNVGGGYNLRIILRRALDFIDSFKWDIKLSDICEMHAKDLKELFPELEENLSDVKKIIEFEEKKYRETKLRNKLLVEKIIENKVLDTKMLMELYDSQGITPEDIKKVALKKGKNIQIPENFYALISKMHESQEKILQTFKEIDFDIKNIPDTEILYYNDYSLTKFSAKVLKIYNNYVALDKTAFYPTSGGQIHDSGYINSSKVVEVVKKGKIILHKVDSLSFKECENVNCEIDFPRRLQLTQHHTATHIVNGAARKILGNHIWQAGAAKTLEKARLDITHYDSISPEELEKIEILSNKIIQENRPVISEILPRKEAEKRYGFRLYQGGAVPGNEIRVVNIDGHDVEACGGTHLKMTEEAEAIKILKTTKIQDGLVRIEFCAGKAALSELVKERGVLENLAIKLDCNTDQIPARCKELFEIWKKAKKGKIKNINEFELKSTESSKGDIVLEACEILKTQKEHLLKTVERFLNDIEKAKKNFV